MGGKTILVVDDKKAIREIIGEILKKDSYEYILCESGERALQHIGNINLLMTDFNMPGMNGAELARKAKQRDSKLPVIIITSAPWDLPADHSADAVIEKPFKVERLREAIAKLLEGGFYG